MEGLAVHRRKDHRNMNDAQIENIARVCHEANRAHCRNHGDESQPTWEEAPDWQKDSIRSGVRFRLEHGDAPASASHDNWSRHKLADGWTWGDVKDPAKKTHPCLVPFDQLPSHQQAKDRLFAAIVAALAG